MRRTGTLRLGATTLAVTAVIGCSGGGQIPGPSSASPAPHSGSGAASATPVNPAARAAGLVDVRTVVPDAIIDLRYATTDNFVGMRLYPANARCLVHESMRPGLRAAAAALRSAGRGEGLVFW
ncbi:MAG: M15 family metallopeptidase, partial [Gordonia amarae]